jgi:hypothetical protein
MKMKKIYLIVFLFPGIHAFAQEGKVDKVLQAIYSQVKQPADKYIDDKVLYKPENQAYAIRALMPWYADSLKEIRSKAIVLTARIVRSSADTSLRRMAVHLLLRAYRDRNLVNSKLAVEYLTTFSKNDFDQGARDTILHLLKPAQHSLPVFIKLAGYLGIEDARPILRAMPASGGLDETEVWAVQLALARMGDERAAMLCADVGRRKTLNNQYINALLPDLVYTHHKKVYDVLVIHVNSDENGCSSPNPNYSGKIPCAYRIIESLCGQIKGYPLQVNAGGDLVTDDYPKALKLVREWLSKNNDYTLKNTAF